MESSLDSVLNGQTAEPTPEAQPAQAEPQTEQVEAVTGEQETGTPPEPKQDDPLDRHRKGLEAAATAERKKRQEAETRAEAAERRAQELEQQFRQPKPDAQQGQPKPTRADFQSEDEWMEAVLDWRDEQRTLAWQTQQQQAQQMRMAEKTQAALMEASKLPGFDINAFTRLTISQPMADAILDSDATAQLVHFLTTNPAEALRISQLSESRQHKEMARIEDRLTAQPKADPPEKPRLPETLTQARNAQGRFEPAYSGPTPLNAILK